MKYELYALESVTDSNPVTYALLRRIDESGDGSPLTWTSREAAEAYIDILVKECDVPREEMELQVVMLTGETGSENEADEHFTVL
jgi:hypothetical protein